MRELLLIIFDCSESGRRAASKENHFLNSCSQERQTWKSLSHANANGERIVPCMIMSYSLGSPPTPPSTRLLASSGALETHLTLYKVGDRQHLSRMHVRLGSLLERITSGMSSWLAGSTR